MNSRAQPIAASRSDRGEDLDRINRINRIGRTAMTKIRFLSCNRVNPVNPVQNSSHSIFGGNDASWIETGSKVVNAHASQFAASGNAGREDLDRIYRMNRIGKKR